MSVVGEDSRSHLWEVVPPVVDSFTLRCNRRGVIYEPFGNFGCCPDLAMDASVGSAKIMKRPMRNTVFHFRLVLAPT